MVIGIWCGLFCMQKYHNINANLQEDAFICELDQEPKALPPQSAAAMHQVNFSLVHFYPLNITHHYLHITESIECAHLYCV